MVIKQPGSTSAGGSMDIQLRHIFKTFGNQEVIHDFSISLKSGCITTFLGPSGCGKTTLLRMIAGLEVPDSGEIYLGSRCVYSRDQKIFVPSQHRGLGFVFQDFALWPHMTVFENVAFGLRASGHTHHLKEAVENALSQVHLSDYANRFPHELSGGQQQRVSFARALAYGSDCILFDEPLSALDAKLREDMRGEMRDLVSRLKTTALFVTHDQREAMEMSDYMVVLSQGRMEQYDVPEVIYSHPATPFTARFVGRSNWLDSHHLFRPEKGSFTPFEGCRSYSTRVLSSRFQGQNYQIQVDWQGQKWCLAAGKAMEPDRNVYVYVHPRDMISI